MRLRPASDGFANSLTVTGSKTVETCIAELRDRSERQMRSCIVSIPDGHYAFTAYLDSDGIVDEPLAVALDMDVKGEEITFDFSRSSPPCRGPLNAVWATTQSAVYVAMKHIFPEVPINAGCFAPLHIHPPEKHLSLRALPEAGCRLCS